MLRDSGLALCSPDKPSCIYFYINGPYLFLQIDFPKDAQNFAKSQLPISPPLPSRTRLHSNTYTSHHANTSQGKAYDLSWLLGHQDQY
jgi:hypothetical protein